MIDHSSKRAEFLSTYRRHQVWPLPDSVVYYITKNPLSPKCYQKMVKSCKYFFIKNPILVVTWLNLANVNNEWLARFHKQRLNLNNFSSRIWVTDSTCIYNESVKNTTFLIFFKICQSDIKELKIWNQNITFNFLKLLATKCEEIFFKNLAIINGDGSVAAVEKVFEALPNVTDFWYKLDDVHRNVITPKTAKELAKIPHFLTLKFFILENIHERFDIDHFYEHIKTNKKTKIWLTFNGHISDAYKTHLQKIVYEIIADENREYKPPFIRFPLNDQNASKKLLILCNKSC